MNRAALKQKPRRGAPVGTGASGSLLKRDPILATPANRGHEPDPVQQRRAGSRYGTLDCMTASRFRRHISCASPYTSNMLTNVTDVMLREAWTAALAHRGQLDAVFDRVNEIVDDAKRLPDQERQRQRRIALAMLREIGRH